MAKTLTRKQQVFVAEYLKDLNATRAAIAAGYSKKRASVAGAELVRNRKVSEIIDGKLGKRLEKLDVSSEKILAELEKLAYFDPVDLFESDGSVKMIKDIPEPTRKVLAGFEVSEIFDGASGEQKHAIGLLKKIKVSDRIRALELLGKYKALWTEKVDVRDVTLEKLVTGHDDD